MILNNLIMFLGFIIKFQESIFSGISLMSIQTAQFTDKIDDSFDVNWPHDLYRDEHGYRDK